jgi:hypothetical protein
VSTIRKVLPTWVISTLCVHLRACEAAIVHRSRVESTEPGRPTGVGIGWPRYAWGTDVAELLRVEAAHCTREAVVDDDPAIVRVARWAHPLCCPRPSFFSVGVRVVVSALSGNSPVSEATISRHVLRWICMEGDCVGSVLEVEREPVVLHSMLLGADHTLFVWVQAPIVNHIGTTHDDTIYAVGARVPMLRST